MYVYKIKYICGKKKAKNIEIPDIFMRVETIQIQHMFHILKSSSVISFNCILMVFAWLCRVAFKLIFDRNWMFVLCAMFLAIL